ncbi:hypothetical protein [Ralstonia phage RSP15]|uniref:hypothetical protein n=1 Tax=Ralstonia phage RSP15 TaxID=1785960 RepID=UPI00074D405D|nr:hypothetical protein BH754_gp228 [Ralstonia phage RSP15]BAU40078.1 hypothetical protein [Ralstonia phage RSP15]
MDDYYTKKELKLWEKVKDYFDKINKFMDENPDLVVFVDDTKLKEGIRFRASNWSCPDHSEYVIVYSEGNSSFGVFSLNEDCDSTFSAVKKRLDSEITFYRKVTR